MNILAKNEPFTDLPLHPIHFSLTVRELCECSLKIYLIRVQRNWPIFCPYTVWRTQWSQIWRHFKYIACFILKIQSQSSKNSKNSNVLALRIRVWNCLSLSFLAKLSSNKGKLFFCKQNAFVNLRLSFTDIASSQKISTTRDHVHAQSALAWTRLIMITYQKYEWAVCRRKENYKLTLTLRSWRIILGYSLLPPTDISCEKKLIRKIWPERDFIIVPCGFAWHVTTLMKSMNNKEPIRIQGVLVFTTVPWSAWVNFQLLFHTRPCQLVIL